MKSIIFLLFLFSILSCGRTDYEGSEIPFSLDHNRMLVSAEMQRTDGTWRSVLLWIDTGNPDFFITPELALDLGIINAEDSLKAVQGTYETSLIPNVRLKKFDLDFSNLKPNVIYSPFWLFKASGADANLPSTVLKKYDIIFDYVSKKMIVAKKGSSNFSGKKIPVKINPQTGIVQVDGIFDNDSISFAIDIGASYSFGSTEFFNKIQHDYPNQPFCKGAIGYANMWGWGFKETESILTRIPKISFGSVKFKNLALTIPPDFNENGFGLMDWYSQKTLKPVDGFLGPNAFVGYKLGIDYLNNFLYLEQEACFERDDLDIVGIIIRLEKNGNYMVIGVTEINGIPVVEGICKGDILLSINDFKVKSKTMGKVVDELRGHSGENKTLVLEREGKLITIKTQVIKII